MAVATVAGLVLMGLIGGPSAQGTTPGRNGRIVFAAEVEGGGVQLFTIRPNGANLRQFTHVDLEATTPDWGPHGRRIAFEFFDGDHAGIAMLNADGTRFRDLTPRGFQGQPAFVPPNGRRLVYDCGTCPGGDGIFIIRDDGSHRRRLTNPPPGSFDTDPNVSPDARTVTFVRIKREHELQALFAVDTHGANVRRLTPYRLEVAIKHDWAPDGRHIVLTRDADYPQGRSPNVATIRPDGSHLRMLTNFRGGRLGAFVGSYSPNGRWIVFRVENVERERFWLYKMRPDGSNRRLIARLPFAPRHMDWGPLPTS